ncbi:MAG: efflux RND transporter periplasmic adaptor subunit [Patescibacteria group bacterium]|nr:efflux RND transporter periplasmic adaptor subunit [Patescibacteria group bacterium]
MTSKFLKFIAIIIILSAAVFFGKDYIFKKDYNIFTVKKSNIVNSVSANGFIVSDLINDLYFNASGKIKKINFQIGDEIKTGDTLAELKAEQEKQHLAQAELLVKKSENLILSNSSLIDKEAKKLNLELLNLEIKLGEIQLNNIKGVWERDIKIEELKIQNIKTALNDNQLELLNAEQKIEQTTDKGNKEIEKNQQSLTITVKEILLMSSSTLIQVDNILGIDNEESNDQFEEYLGVFKKGVFKNAKLVYEEAKNDYSKTNDIFNLLYEDKNSELDTEKSEEENGELKEKIDIMPTAELTGILLTSMDNLLFKTRILLNNTETYELPPNKKRSKGDTKKIFTKNELGEFKSMIDERKNENSFKIDLLENQKESLVLTEKDLLTAQKKVQDEYNKINLSNQEIKKSLEAMRENLINIKEDVNFLIEAAKSDLDKKQKNLTVIKRDNDVKTGADDLKKLSEKAKGLLSLAQKNLDETKLKVLNDCIITDIKNKIGDDISPSQIFAIAISTQVIAEANISESDISKIKIGQKTIFNFDDNLKFKEKSSGEIISVDQDNKKIKAALGEYSSNIIQFGMPIGLTIITAQKNDALIIPQNIIFNNEENKKTVKILINKKAQDKEIKTGIIGDNNMVEIVSGLEEGEEVIIF